MKELYIAIDYASIDSRYLKLGNSVEFSPEYYMNLHPQFNLMTLHFARLH